jgi:hypothetical protein
MMRRTFLGVLACFLPSLLIRKREDAVVVPRTTIQEWMEETARTEGRKVYYSCEINQQNIAEYKRCYF